MPVPNQKINNQFLPLDDLGLEIDPSYRLYLPSDVSLSVATMVGRNGRKPRIVQMDDDGNIFVSIGRGGGEYTINEIRQVCINKQFNDGAEIVSNDLHGYSGVFTIFNLVDIDDNSCSGGIADTFYFLDKSTIWHSSSFVNTIGASNSTFDGPFGVGNPFTRYQTLFAHINPPATSVNLTIEQYLF